VSRISGAKEPPRWGVAVSIKPRPNCPPLENVVVHRAAHLVSAGARHGPCSAKPSWISPFWGRLHPSSTIRWQGHPVRGSRPTPTDNLSAPNQRSPAPGPLPPSHRRHRSRFAVLILRASCGGGLTPTARHRELVWVFKQEFSALDGHAVASCAPFIPRHVGLSIPIFQTSLEPKGNTSLYLRDLLGGLLS
jgi:hypothetical protein